MPKGIYTRVKPVWNKGLKGVVNSGSFKIGHKAYHTEESNKKISLALLGIKRKPKTVEMRQNMSRAHIGIKLSESARKKLSELYKGEKCRWWKGGISKINRTIRGSLEYRLWRESVFKRDNYTCIWCGIRGSQKGGYLEADHIKPFAFFPELRFAIDNGRTLCVPCHRKTDTYGNRVKSK